jgi:hypothetical protein
MMLSFLPTLMALLLMVTSGGMDLLSALTPAQYWAAKGKTPTLQELIVDVGDAGPPGDVKQLVSDLSSSEFKTRSNAQKALEAMGPDVIPQLKDATASKDAEVATVAKAIVLKLSAGAKARDVERLMAIRTLGEKKERSALPALKAALTSKDPFVAEYAARAVGEIEGHPVTAADHRVDVEKDLWLLPKETGTVLQETGMPWGAAFDVAAVAAKGSVAAPGRPAMVPVLPKEELEKRLSEWVVQAAERVGAVRLDGATLAVSADMGDRTGWVVVIAHGQYDRAGVVSAIKTAAGEMVTEATVGSATVLTMGPEARIAFMDGRVVLLTGPPQDTTKDDVIGAIIKAADGGGAGTIKENAALAGLIGKADRSGPLWGASIVPEVVKKEAGMAYDRATLSTKVTGTTVSFVVTGEGSDAEKVKATGEMVEAGVASGTTELKQMAGQVGGLGDALKGEVDVMESLKVKTEGTTTVLTGEAGPSLVESMKSSLAMYAAFAAQAQQQGQQGGQ